MSKPVPFLNFLRTRLERGAFETDEALAAVLPLMRQTVAAHERGCVGCLEDLSDLEVSSQNQLSFVDGKDSPPRRNIARIDELQQPDSMAVEVVREVRHDMDVDSGGSRVRTLEIGEPGQPVLKPCYLPDYASWEHRVDHHDEVTDVFSLGQLLASVACGLDLTDRDDLEIFVHSRSNLFALNPRLHPVVASVITQMTELNRHRRAQDLPSLIRRLETYREQQTDLDLSRIPGIKESGPSTRRKLIQAHLRDRLFDMSRRNRLVYFKPSLQTLNLTLASVPLLLDYQNIQPEQLFTWHQAIETEITNGRPLALGKYLRFEDAPYIPSVLDKIISEARRDRAEFGFSQLRLVLVFLRWHNLKEDPHERIHSPLLLLPVELTRKRGIRDNYVLEPVSSEAEVNPALRHFLKQLYNLDLPETVDLRETSLAAFHTQLETLIHTTEPAVLLHKLERPQIELIHQKARQRLDQYRRRIKLKAARAQTSERADYSYDRHDFRPLGLQLFLEQIKPAPAPLRDTAGAPPVPRKLNMVASSEGDEDQESETDASNPSTTDPADAILEAERRAFAIREGQREGSGNPYSWEFDLCALTLGNFNYRKMTLVQDYANLIDSELSSEAFDRIFSLDPKPTEDTEPAPLPLSEQHTVIACDATQASAIARARKGQSYIIQGPPGTGKSQTITNLIADYVARGKRVLFVCEKRAAIDVVFHRLRQQGLDELCCLIHDSQTDKKAFIQNLKQTSEQWLANPLRDAESDKNLASVCAQMEQELVALRQFSQAMIGPQPSTGASVRALLQRLVELRQHLVGLTAEQEEQLPVYSQWLNHGQTAERLVAALADLGEEPCLAKHPLRWLNPRLVQSERPLETLSHVLERAENLLTDIEDALSQTALPEENWDTVAEIEALLAFAVRIRPLAERNLLGLLDPQSAATRDLTTRASEFEARVRTHTKAASKTTHWREKLPASEAQTALAQADAFKSSFLKFLNPAWWRLRRVLNERYDFTKHAVKPTWTQILRQLVEEWDALDQLDSARQQVRKDYGIDDPVSFLAEMGRLQKPEAQPGQTTPRTTGQNVVETMRQFLLASPQAPLIVDRLARQEPRFTEFINLLREALAGFEKHRFAVIGEAIRDVRESGDVLHDLLPVLSELADCPAGFIDALREFPFPIRQIEAAIAQRTLSDIYRQDRTLNRFDGRSLGRRLENLQRLYRQWLELNAAAIRAGVRRNFLDHVQVSTLPAAQLTPEQKVFKKNYASGRRELEHEFGKTMRFKSIRELAGGTTGQVVRDLKPIWLMSPLSVSDTLPLDAGLFDVVIFDEASQIPLEEAVPALYRAHQVIVVGDEMQLPPTNFFTASREGEEDFVVEEEGERIEVSLDADSFLNQSARNLGSTLLAWHYRSRSELLISFSNAAFYHGKLFTIPDRQLPAPGLTELRVADPSQGEQNAAALLGRSISFHRLERGVYQDRRNVSEATYIAHLVRALLKRQTRLSIGIVAFSEAQQTEIEDALQKLAGEDPDFNARLEAEINREEEDQFCGLFVKNLENVQGDERDIIILSICYGYDSGRKMLMNFGPINQRGGEKRLNVIFSRAKNHMAVVSSIQHQDITNDFNDGANALKNFLHFAEAASKGDLPTAERVLTNLNPLNRKSTTNEVPANPVIQQLAEALQSRGYLIDFNVGQSRFRCDLAVRTRADSAYQLGILVDSERHYRNPDLLERYLMQPSILRAFGWRPAIVLTKDWFHEPDAVLDRLEAMAKNVPEEPAAEPLPEEESAPVQPSSAAERSLAPEQSEELEAPKPGPPPAAPPVVALATPEPESQNAAARNPARRFEFIGGGSRKFWEISINAASFTVRFGRIGTAGQEQTKTFADSARAQREADKLVDEKLRKGYQEIT